ncbi:glycoside hydrolase [Sporodiniella umbellata]|nr:glycoside hydrolase [Sporodiniella umbellata]
MKNTDGVYAHLVNVNTGLPIGEHYTWGGMADSFYEYLIKQLVVSGGKDQVKFDMVRKIIHGLENKLVVDSSIDPTSSFLVEINGNERTNRMDELACFAPGTLLLAARSFPDDFEHIEPIAKKLLKGCFAAWDATATGLAPEIFTWDVQKRFYEQQPSVSPVVASYILRPETLESLYYFYVYTQDKVYQDMAWDIFNSLHTYCRGKSGYSGLYDVQNTENSQDDREESFFFAETLKYLYLIFDDPKQPRFPFNQWVFNTEAHPLKISKHHRIY